MKNSEWRPTQRPAHQHGIAAEVGTFHYSPFFILYSEGPVYRRANPAESACLLVGAYRSSLALAAQHGLSSIAFPSISTGIFGYPVEDAAQVTLGAVRDALAVPTSLTLVRFVLWRPPSAWPPRVAYRAGSSEQAPAARCALPILART